MYTIHNFNELEIKQNNKKKIKSEEKSFWSVFLLLFDAIELP